MLIKSDLAKTCVQELLLIRLPNRSAISFSTKPIYEPKTTHSDLTLHIILLILLSIIFDIQASSWLRETASARIVHLQLIVIPQNICNYQ